jgi:hypothetical protein
LIPSYIDDYDDNHDDNDRPWRKSHHEKIHK